MFNFVRWLAGVVLIFFHLKAVIEMKEEPCSGSTKNGFFYSDSIEKGYDSIPQDCDPSLQVLNVSKNNIAQLNDDDLANYPLLIEFTMKENTLLVKVSPSFFIPVAESLQIIDISYSCFESPFAKLPANMKRVVANGIYGYCNFTLTLPELDHLEFLNELECRENNLPKLPTLHPRAQIQYIDLSKNPMNNLTYSDIAPYCVLSQLNLFVTHLSKQAYQEQCCALKKWGVKSNTSIYLECHSDSPCDSVVFDAKSNNSYEECVRNPGGSFFPSDYYLMNVVIIIAIFLSFGYLALRFFKSRAWRKSAADDKGPMAQLEQVEEENEDASVH